MDKLEEILSSQDIDVSSLKPRDDGYSLVVPCRAGVATWLKLRSLVPRTGHWPVLRTPDDLDQVGPAREYDRRTVTEIIEAARSIDPVEWIRSGNRQQLDDLRETLLDEEQANGEAGDDEEPYESRLEELVVHGGFPRGPWTEDRGPTDLCTYMTQSWTKLTDAAVVLVPAEESWHVPAHLYLGGWNACPEPEEHVAVFAYWYRRHEAEVMTVTHDVVEMRVGRPPTTREEAIALAKEQYIYCSDIVDQGTETIDRLAAGLLDSPVWYFWWD